MAWASAVSRRSRAVEGGRVVTFWQPIAEGISRFEMGRGTRFAIAIVFRFKHLTRCRGSGVSEMANRDDKSGRHIRVDGVRLNQGVSPSDEEGARCIPS